jgi:hypothetical protein
MKQNSKQFCSLAALVACMIVFSSPAISKDYNALGKSGFALWRCASFGLITENKKLQETLENLFVQGHLQLTEFVTDLIAGKVRNEDIKDVPLRVTLYLTSGPSVEFRMGYMWAQFQKDAYEETWPNLKDSNYDDQKDLQKLSAETEFVAQNCSLLLK